MLSTKDNILSFEVLKDIHKAIYQAADWSVMPLPDNLPSAEGLAFGLGNMPTYRHLFLLVSNRRKERELAEFLSLGPIRDSFRYFDKVAINYELGSSSEDALIQNTELGFLFYKGEQRPVVSNTGWFTENQPLASNLWDLGIQPEEVQFFKKTQFQKFSWELQLLMMTMCGPLEHNKFLYGLKLTTKEVLSMYHFCKKFNLTATVYVAKLDEAKKYIDACSKGVSK